MPLLISGCLGVSQNRGESFEVIPPRDLQSLHAKNGMLYAVGKYGSHVPPSIWSPGSPAFSSDGKTWQSDHGVTLAAPSALKEGSAESDGSRHSRLASISNGNTYLGRSPVKHGAYLGSTGVGAANAYVRTRTQPPSSNGGSTTVIGVEENVFATSLNYVVLEFQEFPFFWSFYVTGGTGPYSYSSTFGSGYAVTAEEGPGYLIIVVEGGPTNRCPGWSAAEFAVTVGDSSGARLVAKTSRSSQLPASPFAAKITDHLAGSLAMFPDTTGWTAKRLWAWMAWASKWILSTVRIDRSPSARPLNGKHDPLTWDPSWVSGFTYSEFGEIFPVLYPSTITCIGGTGTQTGRFIEVQGLSKTWTSVVGEASSSPDVEQQYRWGSDGTISVSGWETVPRNGTIIESIGMPLWGAVYGYPFPEFHQEAKLPSFNASLDTIAWKRDSKALWGNTGTYLNVTSRLYGRNGRIGVVRECGIEEQFDVIIWSKITHHTTFSREAIRAGG